MTPPFRWDERSRAESVATRERQFRAGAAGLAQTDTSELEALAA